MRTPALLLTLLLTGASACTTTTQTDAPETATLAAVPADPIEPASPVRPAVVEAAAAPAGPALSPLEAEACRRLQAEAQIATDAANAPPVKSEPEKKPMTRAEGAGALTGSVVGQVAGAAVAGPIGAAVGAIVAGKVGQKVVSVTRNALTSDKAKEEKKAAEQAAADPASLTVPGPPPELLSECQGRPPT